MSNSSKGRSASREDHCSLWGSLTTPLSSPVKEGRWTRGDTLSLWNKLLKYKLLSTVVCCKQQQGDEEGGHVEWCTHYLCRSWYPKEIGSNTETPEGCINTSTVFLSYAGMFHTRKIKNMVIFSIQKVTQRLGVFLFKRSETINDVQIPLFIQPKAILYTCVQGMVQRHTSEACIWQSEN